MQSQSFQLMIDEVPYQINAEPFKIHEGVQYKVSCNQSADFTFAWDDNVGQYISIDADNAAIPSNVEKAIAVQLARLTA